MNTFNINTQGKDKRNFAIKKIPFPYLKLLNFFAGGKRAKVNHFRTDTSEKLL